MEKLKELQEKLGNVKDQLKEFQKDAEASQEEKTLLEKVTELQDQITEEFIKVVDKEK